MTAESLRDTERKIRRQLRSIGACPLGVRRVAEGARWSVALAVHDGRWHHVAAGLAKVRALELWLGTEARA
jgi:hypothetical protein